MFGEQRLDHVVEVAGHDVAEFVERELDAVVGQAAIGVVVCANFFGAVTGADEIAARFGFVLLAFGLGTGLQFGIRRRCRSAGA